MWCVQVGYGRSELVEAARTQMERLPYYNTFFGTISEPMLELVDALSRDYADGALNGLEGNAAIQLGGTSLGSAGTTGLAAAAEDFLAGPRNASATIATAVSSGKSAYPEMVKPGRASEAARRARRVVCDARAGRLHPLSGRRDVSLIAVRA